MEGYKRRAPRLIGKKKQWIQGYIKKDKRESSYNEAFDFFLEELQKGENLLNAKGKAQRKYGVQIEFDTVLPRAPSEKSTLVIKVG